MSTAKGYHHKSAKRRNNPSEEVMRSAKRPAPKRHRKQEPVADLSRTPTLAWARDVERKTVAAPMLMTQERIDPSVWAQSLSAVKSDDADNYDLFDGHVDPDRAKWEWYEHQGNWQNRLIHAAASRAMASLLEHEHMAGAVQCIYFDPPYGMDFDARHMNDTLQVRAFMDTYEKGIHGYLDGIRETAVLARELLSESGSLFMQIGDVNVHECAVLLKEVFGATNHVSTITYATTSGGSSTRSIPKAGDYILWFAKNKDEMHYQPLYEAQSAAEWLESQTFAGGGGTGPIPPLGRLKRTRETTLSAISKTSACGS